MQEIDKLNLRNEALNALNQLKKLKLKSSIFQLNEKPLDTGISDSYSLGVKSNVSNGVLGYLNFKVLGDQPKGALISIICDAADKVAVYSEGQGLTSTVLIEANNLECFPLFVIEEELHTLLHVTLPSPGYF